MPGLLFWTYRLADLFVLPRSAGGTATFLANTPGAVTLIFLHRLSPNSFEFR